MFALGKAAGLKPFAEALFVCTSTSGRSIAIELDRGNTAAVLPPDVRSDRLLISFLSRREVGRADLPLPAAAAAALGLRQTAALLRDLLSREDRRRLQLASTELQDWIALHPAGNVTVGPWSTPWLAPETAAVFEYVDQRGFEGKFRKDLVLVRLRPAESTMAVIDRESALVIAERRQMTMRIASVSAIAMTVAIWILYSHYFDDASPAEAFVALAITLYSPLLLLWLFVLRPFTRLARLFPTISETLVASRARARTGSGGATGAR